jgi:hypothetical protein
MRKRSLSLVCVVAAATLLVSAACTSFGGDAASDPAAATDAGSDPRSDAGSDPGSDASQAAGPTLCVPGLHTFCADFEDPDPLAVWTVMSDGGVTIVGDPARDASGPAVLRAQDARRDAGFTRLVGVQKVLQRPWARVVVNFSLFVAQPTFETGDDHGLGLLALNFVSKATPGKTHGVALSIGPAAMTFGASTQTSISLPRIKTNEWTRIRLDVTPNGVALLQVGTDAEQRVTLPSAASTAPSTGPSPIPIEGGAPTDAGALTDAGATSDTPSIRLEVGSLGWNAPSPAMDVRVDDLTIDFPAVP